MLRTLLRSTIALLLAGCAATATYPPTAGRATVTGNTPPLPQVMASSLRYAQQRGNPNMPIVFNLPPMTLQSAWDDVGKRLGDGCRPMAADDKDAFTVRQVRVNGGKAEVDIVYPSPEGVFQIMTVHLEGGFGSDYRPMFVQRWLVPASAQAFNPPAAGPWSEAPTDSVPTEIEDPTMDSRSAEPSQPAAKH
jgi:hypothetical protein